MALPTFHVPTPSWLPTLPTVGRADTPVAVIGAGLAGLVCAQILQASGVNVTVFEKSRGYGGRLATRRTPSGATFDHGAQYFTARDPRFVRAVQAWQADQVVAEWQARFGVLSPGKAEAKEDGVVRYVGVPGMNAIGKCLAQGLHVLLDTQIAGVESKSLGWLLSSANGTCFGPFKAVISAAPAPQTEALFESAGPLADRVHQAKLAGSWAVMAEFAEPLPLVYDACFVNDAPLSWVARNSSKPGRAVKPETWVLHGSSAWSPLRMEWSPERVQATLLETFFDLNGLLAVTPAAVTVHRWRYALPVEPLPETYLWEPGLLIGACGDWCGGPRVEGAFLSGWTLAEQVIQTLSK